MDTNPIETEYLARLRERMAREGVNQRQLADTVRVSPHHIGRILKGEVGLKVTLLIQICDALGLHAGGLLTESMEAVIAEALSPCP